MKTSFPNAKRLAALKGLFDAGQPLSNGALQDLLESLVWLETYFNETGGEKSLLASIRRDHESVERMCDARGLLRR